MLEFVMKDMQAFSIVEQASFKNFVQKLNSGYALPARKTLSNNMLSAKYWQIVGELKGDLAKVNAVCLTTDAWTSENNDSYIAVTCHYVDENSDSLETALLCCFLTTERHTSANLAQELEAIINEWNLKHKVVAIVTDNASNVVGAVVDIMKKKHIACFAHTLNLAVQDGLDVVKEVHTKAKEIAAHFKRSTVSANKLAQTQREKNKPVLKVKQSTPTRWNSAYEMFRRLLEVSIIIIYNII